MTTKEIVKIVLQICAGGGIVGLDAIAIVFMYLQGKSYLTKVPLMNDYLLYRTLKRREDEMDKDKLRWRDMSSRIYAWLPWTVLASLVLVALVLILSAYFGSVDIDTPQV